MWIYIVICMLKFNTITSTKVQTANVIILENVKFIIFKVLSLLSNMHSFFLIKIWVSDFIGFCITLLFFAQHADVYGILFFFPL